MSVAVQIVCDHVIYTCLLLSMEVPVVLHVLVGNSSLCDMRLRHH